MQLMPATARWTAKKIGLPYTPALITDRDTNLRLGTGYLKLVLDDFGGSQPMAAAAYNAGPGRPRRWREGPVLEPAVWAENIPFTETRDYVKKVLSQRAYYAALLGGRGTTIRSRLGRHDRPARPERAAARQRPALKRAAPARRESAGCRDAAPVSSPRRVQAPRPRRDRLRRPQRLRKAGRAPGGAGGRIRVATRHFARARHLQLLPTVEVEVGDVHDDATLARMLRDTDAVINLVAILHGSEAEFERVHVRLPRRLAAACRPAGVRRVVHVSALGVAVDAPSRYLRSKARGEAALRAAGLDLTVLRPSVIFGERDRFLNLFASLQSVFPVMPLAGAAARFQPVWVEDVGERDRALPRRPRARSARRSNAPARASTRWRELVELAGRWSGHGGRCWRCRPALGRLQALAMELLPGRTLMSRDNIDSMRVANVASGKLPGLDGLGIEHDAARKRSRRATSATSPAKPASRRGERAPGAADLRELGAGRCAGAHRCIANIGHRPAPDFGLAFLPLETKEVRRMQLYIGNKNYSSWSMRAWLVMTHSGIEFTERPLRLDWADGSPFKTTLLALAPTGRVPLLIDDDGFAVWDSLAITEYLAEAFPASTCGPASARQRARARSLCAEMHSGFRRFATAAR